jgi:hypothetical protein
MSWALLSGRVEEYFDQHDSIWAVQGVIVRRQRSEVARRTIGRR